MLTENKALHERPEDHDTGVHVVAKAERRPLQGWRLEGLVTRRAIQYKQWLTILGSSLLCNRCGPDGRLSHLRIVGR